MAFFDWIETVDVELFEFFNGMHSPLADGFWWAVSDTISWLPFFLAIIFTVIANKDRESILILLALAITILLCDQFSVLFKEVVERLRPSRDPSLMYQIHIVNGYRGGLYSFVSSHAANTFGIAMFFSLLVKNYKFNSVMFIWAILNGYSRIYLGVHFPFDVLAGAALGMLLGWISYKGFNFLRYSIPAFSSISSERSLSNYTNSGFKKRDINTIWGVFIITLFYFGLISGYIQEFMP